MVSALLGLEDFTRTALALAAVLAAALSLGCLLAAGRTDHPDRPPPSGLLILTGAAIQLLLVLAAELFAVQAAIEIAATTTP